jgi:hypothetical protein
MGSDVAAAWDANWTDRCRLPVKTQPPSGCEEVFFARWDRNCKNTQKKIDASCGGSKTTQKRWLHPVGKIKRWLHPVGKIKRWLHPVGRIKIRLHPVGKIKRWLHPVGKIKRWLHPVGKIQIKRCLHPVGFEPTRANPQVP